MKLTTREGRGYNEPFLNAMKAIDKNYTQGWYGEEGDDQGPFRWMAKQAALVFPDVERHEKRYLRVVAGHSFPEKELPVLEVFLNGGKIGARSIEAAFTPYVFSFIPTGALNFEFRLDRVFRVEGDPRDMGIMVREAEILTASEAGIYLDGWYLPEPSVPRLEEKSSRWMKGQARCLISGLPENKEKYLKIRAGHPYPGEKNPVLSVFYGKDLLGTRTILAEEGAYYFPLNFSGREFEIILKLDRTFASTVTGDSRALGVLVKEIEGIIPGDEQLLYEQGWYEWEYDDFFPFAWMKKKANIFLHSRQLIANRYISFYAYSEFANFKQRLRVELDGRDLGEVSLIRNWNFYSFPLPEYSSDTNYRSRHELILTLDSIFPAKYHPHDPRELGMKLALFQFHDDEERYCNSLLFHENAILNYEERSGGVIELKSYPLNLGIDLFAKCNMKPPCVYCFWDWMKKSEEGHIEDVVDEKTFLDYGPFFQSARLLINCSIGEPLLHPRFTEILEFCQKHNKIMEISTNGQAFTRRTIEGLVGKPIYLYISLDAATKETYAKIRNDRWETIIPNLELLSEERKKKGNLPKIRMVFIPMRVNRGDLEDYFRLCRRIEADALILRPLNFLNDPKIEHDRGGYHFNYRDELLTQPELEEIFKQCEAYSRKYGILVANQFSFGMPDKKKYYNSMQSDLERQRF